MSTADYPDMTGCCNTHDMCYDACGSVKTDCDSQLKQCLQNVCHHLSHTNAAKGDHFN